MAMTINITSAMMTVAVLEYMINSGHACYYWLLVGFLRVVHVA